MAAQTFKGDLELRIRVLEVQMDNFMRRFEEANLLILDLRGRVEKLEAWGKKTQEGGRLFLPSQEGAPWQDQGPTQDAGILEHGPVNEREEFEDENREQEELRRLEKPDESGELVQDLAANSENQEHFEQGTAELVEDSVELEAAKEIGTELSERVRLAEGAEVSKRGDEEKGNDYELEAEECKQERRIAEEVGKQEEAAQSEAGNEEQAEHDYILEPGKWKACTGEVKLESSEEVEKGLSGERGIQEELVKSKAMEEDNKEKSYELQLAGIRECPQEASKPAARGLCEVAGKEGEMVGSEIKAGEEKEHVSILEVSDVEKGFAGVARLSSKESAGQLSEQAKQKNMIEETMALITADIEEEIDMTLTNRLRRIVDERITKLVESSVTESNQKVKALEGEGTEHSRIICNLLIETQRLQIDLIKAIKRNSELKVGLSKVFGVLNMQLVKYHYFEKGSDELIQKYREATRKMNEGLKYADLEKKYKQFKAKYSYGKERTGHADMGTIKKKDYSQMTFEDMAEELASIAKRKKHIMDSVVRALGTSPVEEYLKVEKVGRTEELEECRKNLVERVQNNPDTGLKLMEAILEEEDEKHDYFWRGVLKDLKLSIHAVVEAGCPLLTDVLLCYGFNCNEMSKEGDSPLHYAARNGNVEVGMTLLGAGACVNLQNASNETPLLVALKHGNTEFGLALLREKVHVDLADDNAITPLHFAALIGGTEIVNELIECEAEVNAGDGDGDTPLHNAAIEGNVLVGERLAAAGADVAVVNNEGSTPLHLAAWQGNITFCFFLINQGVPVDPMNSQNVTPLHLAAMENEGDIVQLLITGGARVNCLDEKTDSPLHYAAKFGNVPMMKTLLRAGANVSAVNARRRTPLHLAAAKGHTEACSLLISAKSDVNASDERDRTPLHMVAMYGGSISVAEVLVKKGANMTAVDRNGLTPFDLGYTLKNVEFAAWLEEEIFARDGRKEKHSRRKKGGRWKK
ncbi:uncharacterized protein LOC111868952 isoform X2 [Cryptotermes secundus]|nr:uncharacterized protein LOC111868952 isoform X3 [Cryptotermes secundus]XP_033609137.1 uncharacterized protein LOC111868952 isoform X2 [Cryptotermes secundus]